MEDGNFSVGKHLRFGVPPRRGRSAQWELTAGMLQEVSGRAMEAVPENVPDTICSNFFNQGLLEKFQAGSG